MPRPIRPPRRKPQVWILANPGAARSESAHVVERLLTAIRARRLKHVLATAEPSPESGARVQRSVQRALAAGCRRFVAAGGDGTVALAAAALARFRERHPRAVLGIVPTGTANVLARDLGVPLDIAGAIELALDGADAIALDAIRAGDRPIFTQVGVGLDARMIRHTTRDARVRHGRLAYASAFVSRALLARPARFSLEIDGRPHRVRAWQVVVANVGTLGAPPFTWGPGIDPSDGVVDICVYRARSWRDTLTLFGRLLSGRHRRDARTTFFRARRQVTIRSHGAMLVQGDGEILGRTPIVLDVVPGAVRICVPRALPATVAAPAPERLATDVEHMVAQRSRTWVLQGWWRHPLTFLGALDAALFLRINALPLGTSADRLLLAVSNVMHYGEGWLLVAVVMMTRDMPGGFKAVAEAMPVLWLTMLVVNYPLKRLFRRARPFRSYVDARLRGPEPRDFSFPSGHTAAAFAGALLFSVQLPALAPAFYALALLVAFSRVYLGVHYPSDVLAGGAVGTALAAALMALLETALRGLA